MNNDDDDDKFLHLHELHPFAEFSHDFSFNPHKTLGSWYLFLHFYKCRDGGSERLSNLLKVTQQENSRAGVSLACTSLACLCVSLEGTCVCTHVCETTEAVCSSPFWIP